ncbi:hypothetical protein XBI1_1870167 [Xenorhabdus bovienii str. Intermedium]|uniref:Uncharacterized protein n=1 Tax=Xenorhabdus bovienii str. Intermedium TaxID=1379677 RepID=A0A077QIN7_XENBV|nr:hypothetical protein XBI1_1870167 [Xenorhabdus bovienii str. Intermedium]
MAQHNKTHNTHIEYMTENLRLPLKHKGDHTFVINHPLSPKSTS